MTPQSRALQSFYTRIDETHQLTETFKRRFEEMCIPRTIPKGDIVFTQGEELTEVLLNLTGLFRSYDPGHQLTLGFTKPLAFVPSVGLFKEGAPLPVTVEAVVTSRVLAVSYQAFSDFHRNDFRWYRILWNMAQEEAADREALRVSMLIDSAAVRYRKFLDTFGPLERHIRIGHVASYLGMTPATLSRIRSKQWNTLLK